MCSNTVFYSLMPSTVSKSEAERSLALVRNNLHSGAAEGRSTDNIQGTATSNSTSAKSGWNDGFVAPEGCCPLFKLQLAAVFCAVFRGTKAIGSCGALGNEASKKAT